MKFESKEQFIFWFKTEINKYVDNSKDWVSPNAYEFGAKQMLHKLSSKIAIPVPYGNGGWKGVDQYGAQIWEDNYDVLKVIEVSRSADSIEHLRHNFDASLKKIEKFSKQVPSIPLFDKFKTDYLLLFDYNVTGKDMNKYSENLQGVFREQNGVIIKIIKEFSEIYSTFDYLDREYLTGIVQTANAARIASEGAKEASNQAVTAANLALQTEQELKTDVDNLKELVKKVKGIKERFEKNIERLNSCFSNLERKKTEHDSKLIKIETQIKSIDKLEERIAKLKNIETTVSTHSTQLSHLEGNAKTIDRLEGKVKNLESLKSELSAQISRIENFEKKLGGIEQSVGRNSSRLETNYEFTEKLQKKNNSFDKKIIWAYIIGLLGFVCSILSLVLR